MRSVGDFRRFDVEQLKRPRNLRCRLDQSLRKPESAQSDYYPVAVALTAFTLVERVVLNALDKNRGRPDVRAFGDSFCHRLGDNRSTLDGPQGFFIAARDGEIKGRPAL